MKPETSDSLKIGLALGSGSSRGWSHIGIIRELEKLGIHPDVVCGTSIGALVGASYVSQKLQKLENWVCSLSKLETARFFEINRSLNGFVNTKRFHEFLNDNVAADSDLIQKLTTQFASVATDLKTGREEWIVEGPLVEAVWASISLPGLFPAIRHRQTWLVDGGLVNPVPVSVCRALGADVVIAVNLNGDIVGKHFHKIKQEKITKNGMANKLTDMVREYTSAWFTGNGSIGGNGTVQPPNVFDAIAGSFNITQDRITRSRLAGDPPDIILTPRLSHIGLLEFYRAAEAIAEGRRCVERMKGEIEALLD